VSRSPAQVAHDAVLEAEAWKQTASRWRKRALQESGRQRRKHRELRAEVEVLEEKLESMSEELASAQDNAKRRIATETVDLKKERDEAKAKAARVDAYEAQANRAIFDRNQANARAARIETESAKAIDFITKERDVARAALQVAANRLGIKFSAFKDPHELASAIDAAVLKLLPK